MRSGTEVQGLVLSPHSTEVMASNVPAGWGPYCVSVFSLTTCRFPPGAPIFSQRHAGWVNWLR